MQSGIHLDRSTDDEPGEEDTECSFSQILDSVGLVARADVEEVSGPYPGSDESSQISEDIIIVGKKRKLNRIPRIFKSDIRRQYSTMLFNVLNSSDYSMMTAFFRNFSTNSMMVKIKGVGQNLVPKNVAYFRENRSSGDVTFEGKDWVKFHFFSMQRMTFDQILSIKNATIVAKKNSKRSAIVMDTELSFSQFFDATPYEMVDALFSPPDSSCRVQYPYKNSSVDRQIDNKCGYSLKISSLSPQSLPVTCPSIVELSAPLSSRLTSANMPSEEEIDNIPDPHVLYQKAMGKPLRYLTSPRPISFSSRLVVFLDENKCIETLVLGNDDILDFSLKQLNKLSIYKSSSSICDPFVSEESSLSSFSFDS